MHLTHKTILIVCEGDNTEPTYFNSIRDIIIAKNEDVYIRIIPVPKEEELTTFQLRSGAKRRVIKTLSPAEEALLKSFEVEDEFKAQPVRYVRQAQLGLQDGAYSEVWAVFDKDRHPAHEDAFRLASKEINGKLVNIGFSSISFEEWVLLHFELNTTAFQTSQCRIGKKPIDCGSKVHEKDCLGTNCICGYLKVKKYFHSDQNLKEFRFQDLPDWKSAVINAVSLNRHFRELGGKVPLYDRNPYSDVYRLVFRLLMLPQDYKWERNLEWVDASKYQVNIEFNTSEINVRVKNLSNGRFIFNHGQLSIIYSNFDILPLNNRIVIAPLDEIQLQFVIQDSEEHSPLFLINKINESEFNICDIP